MFTIVVQLVFEVTHLVIFNMEGVSGDIPTFFFKVILQDSSKVLFHQ